ncbi:hypothetical protein [Flavobacterium yafengii]|uniref:Uncharacterized protein n=1 Tax=Flavobacterium yafengii TaxID=3041253 RepID=A0AAW6TNV3_9FLAO|nr:hypothetical protein [Flavobacterium yafengii]MDI5949243.1 hypothetical protein [Flavobacterium yafengii]
MVNLKKYNFEIRTLRSIEDKSSPHTLIKFEFLAKNLKSAEDYMNSLIKHYDQNQPYIPNFPWETTLLIETTYLK